MAPGQVPHHTSPWWDAQALYLLSPLMGILSRAWSLLRVPGPLQPWLAEARRADELEAGVEGDVEAPPEGSRFLWPQNPEEEPEDIGATEENGEAAPGPGGLDLKVSSCSKAWGLSCGDTVEYGKEKANRLQPGEFTHGQPAPLSPTLLLSALQGPDKSSGEKQTKGREAAEEQGETKLAYLSSHCQGGPVREEQGEDGEAASKEAATASVSPLAPELKPSTWLCCPGEEEEQATENKGTENTETKRSISPSWSGPSPGAWHSCSGEAAGKDSKVREVAQKGAADPEPRSLGPQQGPLHGSCEDHPSENAEDKDKEQDEDPDSRWAEEEREAGDSSTITTNAFLRAWVYQPGEDTEDENEEEEEEKEEEEEVEEEEEEDEDSDLGSGQGGADASSSTLGTSTFLRAWVYRPGEDTEDEDEEDEEEKGKDEEDEGSDSGSAQGEADASSSTLGTSTFLRAWVYRPGEVTEDEDEWEENQDTGGDLGAVGDRDTDLGPGAFPQLQGAQLSAWTAPPGERTREKHAAEAWIETEPRPLAVAMYVPGQTPPAPWPAPKLPLRLQKKLRLSKTLPEDQDPKLSAKDRKVRFSEKITVHLLAVWAGPAQAARRGPWEQLARDRSRFARRIARAQEELGPCLTPAWRARAWARLGNPPGPTVLTPPPPLSL
nr:LOW QUALITY PROTEIN: protein phosphatase 1 regulatory subunit 15A [Cavia porcellus]